MKMNDLETLFPEKQPIKIRGETYEIAKISVSQMTSANALAQVAFSALNADVEINEVEAASMATDAIMVMLDDGPIQAKLEKLVKELAGIDGRLFRHLEIVELVGLIIAIVRHNQDFFALRLPRALRNSMVSLTQK
jgi:hypothetical protein